MKNLNGNLTVKRIEMECCDQVLDLVKNYYTEQTQTYRMLKYDLEEGREINAKRATSLLSYGISVGIFEKNTNHLVAMCLNAIEESGNPPKDSVVAAVDPKQQIAWRFFESIENDVLQLLKTEKVVSMHIATVHSGYRNQGLLAHMVMASAQIAKEVKCEYVVATFTTAYFPKTIGFQIIKQVRYSEYLDRESGIPPFRGSVIEPHTHATVVVFEVPNAF